MRSAQLCGIPSTVASYSLNTTSHSKAYRRFVRLARGLDGFHVGKLVHTACVYEFPYRDLAAINTGINVYNQFRTDPTPEQLDTIMQVLFSVTTEMEGQTAVLNNIGNILTWTYLQTAAQTGIMIG